MNQSFFGLESWWYKESIDSFLLLAVELSVGSAAHHCLGIIILPNLCCVDVKDIYNSTTVLSSLIYNVLFHALPIQDRNLYFKKEKFFSSLEARQTKNANPQEKEFYS